MRSFFGEKYAVLNHVLVNGAVASHAQVEHVLVYAFMHQTLRDQLTMTITPKREIIETNFTFSS